MTVEPDRPLNWGIVATGGIAGTVVEDLARLPDAIPHAVSSRRLERAEEFAARHGVRRAYGDYRALLDDPDVDVVYVATPHSQHHEVSRAALLAGKHVLCEKAFTVTVAQAEELTSLARARGLFLMEAMWTRFNPLIRRLGALLADGAVGEVRSVRADFGFAVPYDPAARLWDPAQGGGALLDLGVYPVSFAHLVLGEPTELTVRGSLAANGVDAEAGLLLGYPDGRYASLGCTLVAHQTARASVVGTTGRLELADPFFNPSSLTLVTPGRDPEVFEHPIEGRGYGHQLREVHRAVRAGEVESPLMRHEESVAVMRTLVRALRGLGAVTAS
ncbi:Gfo/Idh/MocA family protein [Actinoalloteichus spitiensis]|uniref:Gfo/Idh/MocA family protein n=1 Tax=Actinoalloteichus spitiensis TaxID=252394 RepID=UPI001B7FCD2D|nr:Gfo/Idh/MocA family oxidoreductase [Actinoalloteichus spitiensis]